MTQPQCPIGVNLHPVPDLERALDQLRALNPRAITVLNEAGTARRLKEMLPQTEIIFRFKSDADNDDGEGILKRTPGEWLAWMGAKLGADQRIVLYAGNEMPLSTPVIEWLCALIDEANKTGWRVGVLSLATGNPGGEGDIAEKWAVAKLLLLKLAEHRQHYLFLHEYFGAVPTTGFYGGEPDNAGVVVGGEGGLNLIDRWPMDTRKITLFHCGRFRFLLAYCDREKIRYPCIGLTEFGSDLPDDLKAWHERLVKTPPYPFVKGWRTLTEQWRAWYGESLGRDAEKIYARMCTYLWDAVYAESPIEWADLFCYGDSGGWGAFSLWGAGTFFAEMRVWREKLVIAPPLTSAPLPGPVTPPPNGKLLTDIFDNLDAQIAQAQKERDEANHVLVRADTRLKLLLQLRADMQTLVKSLGGIP